MLLSRLTSAIIPLFLIGTFLGSITSHTIRRGTGHSDDSWMHARARVQGAKSRESRSTRAEEDEHEKYWFTNAQDTLRGNLATERIEGVARNVILFVGDGMSIPTITAARIYSGQLQGRPGEEGSLHFETFPYMALSKTFCSDSQVADSACAATAYLCGSKANIDTIGVSPRVTLNNCTAQMDPTNQLDSILSWAQSAGKSTGVVTTTRITHASPAGTYAHSCNRDMEDDAEVRDVGEDPNTCDDIAEQLILKEPGMDINVILGGGRRHFVPAEVLDPESGEAGRRTDGQDLIQHWKDRLGETGRKGAYITGRQDLLDVDVEETDYLFGLFSYDHLAYKDEEGHDDPSLAEMVEVAIRILDRNPNGYFLFVEGGRIDHAHHDNFAQRALVETIEFDNAIRTADSDSLTKEHETLIVVTADHSHVMSINGYSDRGTGILDKSDSEDEDGHPYTTLSYANGPGYRPPVSGENGCQKANVTDDPFNDMDYQQEVMVHLSSETHGGDDVAIFAKGPFAHLYSGVQYQSYIPHVMAYASCIGPGMRYC